nr:glycoside hydrolase family 2 TIM barrel-domain containing protein [uncultured Gemmiger sp.]
MRNIVNINRKWAFRKNGALPETFPTEWDIVNLPHTWNNIDGQDGGNDYWRGTGLYVRTLNKADLPEAGAYFLEINGANSSADVYLNGEKLAHHDGGYSTWRVDLTAALQDENLLAIAVDNASNDHVYPQVADFTFYGGLYRDVNIVCVPATHFDLSYYGGNGLCVTPDVSGRVVVETWLTGDAAGAAVRTTIRNAGGDIVAQASTDPGKVELQVTNVHLWNGRKDPYLYTVEAELLQDGTVVDAVSRRFGFRSYKIDPDKGFILNGQSYPLHGVSRHQDGWQKGNAISKEDHIRDMDLICEVGANTIRLAHYQHDQFFYDLCDERGMVVWAEIPYISQHMPAGRENTLSQMKELIVQNRHHASIVVWGLSNEITMKGDADPDLLENHRLLNGLCHTMDPSRPTVMAVISMCPTNSPYLNIPDAVSYNHYFGWYGGNTDMNGPWFDDFHAQHPTLPIGCSEYGCEALNWHSDTPKQGDYTEEYQAHYHEELIKQLFTRPYIWATHVWNMFDFGADARNEGGENGQNHKGLVTIDRKYKKDAFYAYKAWLSDEPFVHLCGKRFVNHTGDTVKITVYSNQPQVELFANGVSLGVQTAEDHFFRFTVPNKGTTELVAVAGDLRDSGTICHVDEPDEAYRLKEQGTILNWFDITEKEGFFSLNDQISDIMTAADGKKVIEDLLDRVGMGGKTNSDDFAKMIGGFTVLRLSGLVGTMGENKLTKEELLDYNARLNQVAKP